MKMYKNWTYSYFNERFTTKMIMSLWMRLNL